MSKDLRPVLGEPAGSNRNGDHQLHQGNERVVSFDLGVNASGAVRRMKDTGAGTNFLTCEIYRDAGRTTVWNAVNKVTLGPSLSKNTALTAARPASTIRTRSQRL
jgi:spore coat protein U-like protein